MFAAELRNKLSPYNPPSQRSEDLLTSHVFSAFRYIEGTGLLAEFLRKAVNQFGDNLELDTIDRADIFFWPKFSFPNAGRREPDVLLLLETRIGIIVICVEAKLDSGLSNISSTPNILKENELAYGHQLTDHFCGLHCGDWILNEKIKKIISRSKNKYLIYLTSHYELPGQDLQDATIEIKDKRRCTKGHCSNVLEQNLYWLSWRTLVHIIKSKLSDVRWREGDRLLLTDLVLALEMRGLMSFDPFARLCPLQKLDSNKKPNDIVPLELYEPIFAGLAGRP